MNASLLDDAFGHHVWATVRLLDACEGLTPDQLATTVPGTYGSIIGTLRHTVGADCSYLNVLSGLRRPQIEEDRMDISALRVEMERNGPAWAKVIAADLDPTRIVVRHRDDGTDSWAPLSIRLAQVLHHGTDHRSQVCTALTTLGIEPPEIDVWAYGELDGRIGTGPSAS